MNRKELIALLSYRAKGNRIMAELLEESLPDSSAFHSGNAHAYEKVIKLLRECE